VAFVPIWSVSVKPAKIVTGHPALSQLQTEIASALSLHVFPAGTDPALSLFLPSSSFGLPAMIQNCNPPTYVTTVPTCAYGDTSSTTTVVLYGNSQAQMWAPALALLGVRDHFKLVPIAKPACGTFVDSSYIGPNGQVSPLCGAFVRWAVERMNALHPAVVLVASTPGSVLRPGANPHQLGANGRLPSTSIVDPSTARTVADFTKLVHELRPSRARVVLLSGIPLTYVHPQGDLTPTGCLLANLTNVQKCTLVEPTLSNSAWLRSFTLAAERSHVAFVNVNPLLCSRGFCPPIVADVLVKFDHLHLTGTYVDYTVNALGELLTNDLPHPVRQAEPSRDVGSTP
jgi:hypothetical protein